DIIEPVVIVVADGDPQAEHRHGKAGLAGYVRESAILIVVVKLERGCTGFRMSGPVFTVDQNNVGIAVVVVVDEGTTRAHRLRQPLFSEGTVVVSEVNAGLRSNVAKVDLLLSRGCS